MNARIGNPDAAHLYELTVIAKGPDMLARHGIAPHTLMVDANNHDHASRLAERCGWTVCDVNMVG